MDQILEQTIKLACLIRDSQEGHAWRKSQEELYKHIVMPDLSKAPLDSASIVERFSFILSVNGVKTRALFLPLLVKKYMPEYSLENIRNELQTQRDIWPHYRQLESRTLLVFLIITFLRRLAPGFPHSGLIYTMPNSIWSHLSSIKEIPWDSEFRISNNVDGTLETDFARVVPTSARVFATELQLLATLMRHSETWLDLAYAYKMIEKHPNLRTGLLQAKQQYLKELAAYQRPDVSDATWYLASERLAKQAYERRGKRIQNYIRNFLKYERLIERIYWLLSQLLIFQNISFVSSSIPQQLQQICLGGGRETFFTALALTQGKTMSIGQLIHVTMPEMDGTADGIYQVNWLKRKFTPEHGFHLYFRAQRLWHCTLEVITGATQKFRQPTLVPTEDLDMVSNTRMAIMEGNNVVGTFEVGQFLSYDVSETMYLP